MIKENRKVLLYGFLLICGLWLWYLGIYFNLEIKCTRYLDDYKNGKPTWHVTEIINEGKTVGYFVYDANEFPMHPGFDVALIELDGKRYWSNQHFCAGPTFEEYDDNGRTRPLAIYINDIDSFVQKIKGRFGFK